MILDQTRHLKSVLWQDTCHFAYRLAASNV